MKKSSEGGVVKNPLSDWNSKEILCRIGIVQNPSERGIVEKSYERRIMKNPLSDWNSKEILWERNSKEIP